MQSSFIFGFVYFLSLLIVLLSRWVEGWGNIEYVSKPLLMLILMGMLWRHPQRSKMGVGILMSALFFSWGGDVFLMFESQHELAFIFGLLSFLIAHICYIVLFTKDSSVGWLKKNVWAAVPILLYGVGLMSWLWSYLNELKIPVLVYASSIMGMGLLALNRKGNVNEGSFWTVFIGALLFVLSDSMIAINKFYEPIPYAQIWIMITYALSQWMIVKGWINGKTEKL